MRRAQLLIYAKPPRMGLAKTRLARSLGSPTQARRIAMMTLARTIGADAPDITPALIRRAIVALQAHDAVFGPASDGGFWLFGLNKTARTRSPFGPVRWSGPHAMADVRRNLPARARVAELPMLIDLDEAEDWHAWSKNHA